MNDSDFDWRSEEEQPRRDSKVAFDLIHDPVRREGRYRESMFIQIGDSPKVWSARSVQRWVYLDEHGKLTKKVG